MEAKKEKELAISSEVFDFWPSVASCAGLDHDRLYTKGKGVLVSFKQLIL